MTTSTELAYALDSALHGAYLRGATRQLRAFALWCAMQAGAQPVENSDLMLSALRGRVSDEITDEALVEEGKRLLDTKFTVGAWMTGIIRLSDPRAPQYLAANSGLAADPLAAARSALRYCFMAALFEQKDHQRREAADPFPDDHPLLLKWLGRPFAEAEQDMLRLRLLRAALAAWTVIECLTR